MVSNSVHQGALLEAATLRGKVEILERQAAANTAYVNFLCARVNQLEAERAALFEKVTEIRMPVPSFAVQAPAAPRDESIDAGLAALAAAGDIFADMGDAEAERQGVAWDAHGHVINTAKRPR